MYKTRSRYLKHTANDSPEVGIKIDLDYKGKGFADIYRLGTDYYIRIKDDISNLLHYSDRNQVKKYARKKIRAAIRNEAKCGYYIKKIDYKLHNLVPDSIFKGKSY